MSPKRYSASGDYEWEQQPCQLDVQVTSIPTDRAKPLTQAEITQIWQAQAPPASLTPAPAEKAGPPPPPKNIILYGPPGTGKTYHTVQRALELILGPGKVGKMSRETQTRQFRELQREGRIEFVTFHQNYGYEEFIEGLRPVLSETTGNEVLYEIHDGVFKRIALRAAAAGLPANMATGASFETLWRRLIDQLREDGQQVVKSHSDVDLVLELSSRENITAYRCDLDEEGEITERHGPGKTASKERSSLIWQHRDALGPDPEQVTRPKTKKLFVTERGGKGGHPFTALWAVYKAMWELHQEMGSTPDTDEESQARAQEAIDKPTPGTAEFGFSSKTRQHVLVIDEINRGNISKILGELITLLEPEKRLGQPEELKLPLAYTPEHRFAVPPNLHIIGTMNTADRSIALMDVALRRRFTFEEMMPKAELISEVVGKGADNQPLGTLAAELFEAMNARIRFLYDRDHQLGHAYFLKVRSLDDLRLLFVDKLIPLLQEYFYEAWDKICLVLGCPYDESGNPARTGAVVKDKSYVAPIIEVNPLGDDVVDGWENDDYEPRLDYEVSPALKDAEATVENILPYFLGVGNFNAEELEHYRSTLTHLEESASTEEDEEAGE